MKLSVEIDGAQVPLDDCDWVLRRPCGCVEHIMAAAQGTRVYAASEADAWAEFFEGKATRQRERERLIKAARNEGCRVELMWRHEAVDELMKPCPHKGGGRDA